MKRLALLFTLLAGPVAAGPCGPAGDDDIVLLEAAKAAFLASDYTKFAELAGNYFPDLQSNFDDYFGQIQVVLPDGFDRCQTVLQRREEPGFYQDLVFYFPKGSDAPMALLLIAAKVGSDVRLVEFTYNTSISEVLEELK